MAKRIITNEERNNAVLLSEKGLSTKEIASILNLGSNTVMYILRANERVGKLDYEGVRNDSGLMQNNAVIKWACEINGVNYDSFIETVVNGEKKQEPEEPKKEQAKPDACITDLEDAIHVASRLITDKVTEQIHTEAEMLARKLDQIATIIQSVCREATMKQNANADIALQEAKKQTEVLSWIRSNTKRKGFN